jgi:hypothetical protein
LLPIFPIKHVLIGDSFSSQHSHRNLTSCDPWPWLHAAAAFAGFIPFRFPSFHMLAVPVALHYIFVAAPR